MNKTAVFPGSFDPFTIGHESIVNRALSLFDTVIIAIGSNSQKPGYFPDNKRKEWIEKIFMHEPKVIVEVFDGLTVEFCKRKNAGFILRGLRTSADFEYERAIAQINKEISPQIESVFFLTLPEHTHITSTLVREVHMHGGDITKFVPEGMM
ncbi:MAG: pantetheine-phosphate adenylyltransferase [Bacteroidia bacterium]|nr:pantetheine-phosphate adenylyltransferase [Bacteroidia bacterium]